MKITVDFNEECSALNLIYMVLDDVTDRIVNRMIEAENAGPSEAVFFGDMSRQEEALEFYSSIR